MFGMKLPTDGSVPYVVTPMIVVDRIDLDAGIESHLQWALDEASYALEEAMLAVDEGMTTPLLKVWFDGDLGYALGAVLAGVTADAFGLSAAIWLVAGVTAASGLVVALRMRETLKRSA